MDATHVHLIINHIPTLVTPLALIILIWGLVKDITPFKKLAMWGFLLAGIAAYVAFESGEGAEETVEQLAGIGEDIIHEHEEMAEWSFWVSIVLGVISIAGFYLGRMKNMMRQSILVLVIVLGVISTGLMSYTAYLGGQIRHTEIRPQQSQVQQPAGETESGIEYEESDD